MAELTPIERVKRFFNREPVDKMPFFTGMGMVLLPAIKKLGYNFPSVHRNAERLAYSGIESARMFGLDSIVIPYDMCWESEALGNEISLYEDSEDILYPTIPYKNWQELDQVEITQDDIDNIMDKYPMNLLPEAVKLVKELASAKFDESVDVATRLGVDPRKADQLVRGTVVLPHGTGKTVRVLVIAQGEKEAEAKEAGADYVGVEFVDKIQQGWLDFDVCVATPDLMGKVGPLGRVLGPRGLMPTPKAGTVTFDIGRAVEEIKAGKIEFRVDKTGNVHAPIGKASFSQEQLEANLAAFMDQIVRAKPSAAKGTYLKSVTVSSTMGPGVSIDPNLYRRA